MGKDSGHERKRSAANAQDSAKKATYSIPSVKSVRSKRSFCDGVEKGTYFPLRPANGHMVKQDIPKVKVHRDHDLRHEQGYKVTI